jgi:glycosyltransferase involved in cell wall biosynthesis
VASDQVGAARDLIAAGHTGLVYPCGDVDALAGVLGQALVDRAKLSEIGRMARARMETWSPRENIDATLDAVTRGVARAGRRSTKASLQDPVPDSSRHAAHKLSE